MTRRRPRRPEGPVQELDPETELAFRELIGLLAGMCAEADEHGIRAGRPGVAARRVAAVAQARPLAVALARCVAAGDAAGADRLLVSPRTAVQWRELALLLASAADIERLAGAPLRSAA